MESTVDGHKQWADSKKRGDVESRQRATRWYCGDPNTLSQFQFRNILFVTRIPFYLLHLVIDLPVEDNQWNGQYVLVAAKP